MSYITYDELTATFLPVLRDQLVLPNLITISGEAGARAHVGTNVSMAKPRRRTAVRRDVGATAAITPTASVEDEITIALVDDIVDACPISDAELTLDIRNFGIQVMQPQLDAVADYLESAIATLIEGATYNATGGQISHTGGTTDPIATVTSSRSYLNTSEVPLGGRILLCGDDFEQELLNSDKITDASQSDSSAALREATLGRVRGFTVIGSTAISTDKAFAFHPSAFLAALRAPMVPAGAVSGSSRVEQGIPMTIFRDYDALTTVDRQLVRTFFGGAVNYDHVGDQDAVYNPVFQRAVEITVI